MDLFDNQVVEEKTKNKKVAKYIIIAIVVLTILCLIIGGLIVYLQSMKLKVYIDDAAKTFSQDTFVIEDSGKVYVSIKDIAKTFNYEYFNGEYGKASEDTTKGFVKSKEEVAAFEANSRKVYKTPNSTDSNYEYFYINDPFKLINGKLYATPEGINTAFNVNFDYNKESNTITIYSLPYLVQYYTTKIAGYGYSQISDTFNNKKAMINGMIVVKKEDRKVGVTTTEGKEIIGAKYDEVQFIETTKDFFVTSASKMGLVTSKGETRIGLLYDKITLLDKDLELYLAENSGKKGVLDKNGNILIYLEYQTIGIDKSQYKTSDIKNPYLLFDNCIPVKQNNKWGIFNKAGKIILPIEYDSLGCVVSTSSDRATNNVIIIPDYEAIVVARKIDNKLKYGIYNSIGNELVAVALDSVYSITSSGKEIYEMEYQGNRLNVEEYFKAHDIYKTNKSSATPTSGEKDVNITGDNTTDSDTKSNITE